MGYRDEAEALRARLEQLEHENRALRRENDELRGASTERPTRTTGERLAGGPLVVSSDRTFEGELGTRGHEAVLEVLRESRGALGEAQVIGGTLTWRLGPPVSQRMLEVVVSAREGRTRVRIVERLGSLAGGLFGGIVGGVGGGGLGLILPLLILARARPGLLVAALPLWVLGVFALVRTGYGRAARRRARELEALAAEVHRVVEREIAHAGGPKVRVGAEDAIPEELRDVAAQDRARTSKA